MAEPSGGNNNAAGFAAPSDFNWGIPSQDLRSDPVIARMRVQKNVFPRTGRSTYARTCNEPSSSIDMDAVYVAPSSGS
jgi:hypothetical protein